MEYLKKEDYNAIKDLIDEFIGDTVLGNHLFKAIKVYFKQKDAKVVYTPNKSINGQKDYEFIQTTDSSKLQRMDEEAEKAMLKYNNKLKEQLNGITKSKKKTN